MSSRKSLRSSFVAGLVGMALLAAACGASTDPGTWEEAEADGDKVRLNFEQSCEEANAAGDGDVPAFCDCSYGVIREFYADDFGAFKDAESELRSNPEAINNSTVIPTALRIQLDECAAEYLA